MMWPGYQSDWWCPPLRGETCCWGHLSWQRRKEVGKEINAELIVAIYRLNDWAEPSILSVRPPVSSGWKCGGEWNSYATTPFILCSPLFTFRVPLERNGEGGQESGGNAEGKAGNVNPWRHDPVCLSFLSAAWQMGKDKEEGEKDGNQPEGPRLAIWILYFSLSLSLTLSLSLSLSLDKSGRRKVNTCTCARISPVTAMTLYSS